MSCGKEKAPSVLCVDGCIRWQPVLLRLAHPQISGSIQLLLLPLRQGLVMVRACLRCVGKTTIVP
jgi:hypothetical protein